MAPDHCHPHRIELVHIHDLEVSPLDRVLRRERQRYARDRAAAAELAGRANGDPELAPWIALAQLVLNLDEVLCRP